MPAVAQERLFTIEYGDDRTWNWNVFIVNEKKLVCPVFTAKTLKQQKIRANSETC
jgi:hypothetical protein